MGRRGHLVDWMPELTLWLLVALVIGALIFALVYFGPMHGDGSV
jgi:hypothetical protein